MNLHISEFDIKTKQALDIFEQTRDTLVAEFNERKNDFIRFKTNTETGFGEFYKNSFDNIANLKKLYEEDLRLKKPAKYWSDRAWWTYIYGWAILIILIGLCFYTGDMLYQLIDKIDIRSLIKLQNINTITKTSLILFFLPRLLLLSFLGYGIKILSKFMFSTFHISADCKERSVLTYFYLSLLNETSISDDNTKLIYQSLFSRADTGLLKEESVPTMPSPIFKVP